MQGGGEKRTNRLEPNSQAERNIGAKKEASGLNPASELLSGEQLGNKERMAGIHIDNDI